MIALSTGDALRMCAANIPRPDLLIHENGAWYLPNRDIGIAPPQGWNNVVAQGKREASSFRKQAHRSDLLIRESDAIYLDDFEVIVTPRKSCVLS